MNQCAWQLPSHHCVALIGIAQLTCVLVNVSSFIGACCMAQCKCAAVAADDARSCYIKAESRLAFIEDTLRLHGMSLTIPSHH
jgi:hypothetical protein